MYAKMKNSYARNESMNIKEYHKKELSFFVHTWQNACISKICPCFCGVTVFCYWYNFSNLGRRVTMHNVHLVLTSKQIHMIIENVFRRLVMESKCPNANSNR